MDRMDRMDEFIEKLNEECRNGWTWSIEDFEVWYGTLQPKWGQTCGDAGFESRMCDKCRESIRNYDVTADYIELRSRVKKLEEAVALLNK